MIMAIVFVSIVLIPLFYHHFTIVNFQARFWIPGNCLWISYGTLTNIIQLVRFALHQIERLDSVVSTSKQYFNLWIGQNQREITDKQREVISRIVDYIASNGACTIKEIREDDVTQAAQMIRAFGSMQKADEALQSLYTFIVLRKAA